MRKHNRNQIKTGLQREADAFLAIAQFSPTKILPEKISVTVFPATKPVIVPLPLLLNVPPVIVKPNVPLSCPSTVTVPERLTLVPKLVVVI